MKHTLDIVIMLRLETRGVAQFGLARLHGVQEAGGSNPLTPTSFKRLLRHYIHSGQVIEKSDKPFYLTHQFTHVPLNLDLRKSRHYVNLPLT